MLSKFILCVICLQILGIYGILALNETCENNSDCSDNAICKDEKCTCDQISFLSSNICLPYVTEYQSYCQESEQCEWLGDNSDCINNVCVCKKNFRWYQGKCQKYVGKGDDCKKDIDCFDKNDPLSLKCDSGKCICSLDYYDRGFDCRKVSKDGKCAIDMDCTNELVCHVGKCIKKSDKFLEEILPESTDTDFEEIPINKVNLFQYYADNITCTYDSDCKNMMNSLCDESTKTCRCRNPNQFIYEGNCLPGFGTCGNKNTCEGANQLCFHDVCICKQGFFFNEGKCIPELGMADSSLKNISDCLIKPAKIQDNTCFCLNYWFGDESNRNCIKTTLQQTLSCLTNDWCNAMGPNSFCNSDKKCQCNNSTKFNTTTFYCDGTNTSGECLRDSDCPFNEQCLLEKCECIENFSRDNKGICQPGIGGSCEIMSCSYVESAGCIQGLCQCNKNYIDYDEGKAKKCLKIADNWNDTCEVTEQCQNFKFTECSRKYHKCNCVEKYKNIEGVCWQTKEYGDPCMNERECTKVLNKYYQCRNSQCLCPIGQTLEKGYCIISSTNNFGPSLFLLTLLLSCFILM